MLREYILIEAMHRLGVPTTRALAAVSTGEQVVRDEFLPGAVLARVAGSHIRIGTFQYFSAQRDNEALSLLVDHVLERHYPDQGHSDNPALTLLRCTITRQAQLVAQWQLLGFIHGVMNTDNMLLSGETIDYGPCAFMDDFHPDKVFSSIDRAGRYAYRNQPGIAHWNLACLAQALLPVLHPEQDQAVALAQETVDTFPDEFLKAHSAGMAQKLGLSTITAADTGLVEDLFQLLADHSSDFTLAFRRLADLAAESPAPVSQLFEFPDSFAPWLAHWRDRLGADTLSPERRQAMMYSANPAFIPRNHLVQEAIHAAEVDGNLQPFKDLHQVLENPTHYDAGKSRYAMPPRPEQEVRQTFCGT